MQVHARVIAVDLLPHGVVRRERVFFAGEDVYVVLVGERVAERLGVDLGPRVVTHRVAVDDLEDLHEPVASRRVKSVLFRRSWMNRARPSRRVTRAFQPISDWAR